MSILNPKFRYHDSTSHATSDGLRSRMKRYAKQMQKSQDSEAIRKVTPIKERRRG